MTLSTRKIREEGSSENAFFTGLGDLLVLASEDGQKHPSKLRRLSLLETSMNKK
jgi:hypothetical protein